MSYFFATLYPNVSSSIFPFNCFLISTHRHRLTVNTQTSTTQKHHTFFLSRNHRSTSRTRLPPRKINLSSASSRNVSRISIIGSSCVLRHGSIPFFFFFCAVSGRSVAKEKWKKRREKKKPCAIIMRAPSVYIDVIVRLRLIVGVVIGRIVCSFRSVGSFVLDFRETEPAPNLAQS